MAWLRAIVSLVIFLGLARAAGAQGASEGGLVGLWRASPLRVQVEVLSWGPDCGPRPPTSSTEPGGRVRIALQQGALVLSGAVQGRSDACWSANRALRRLSATRAEGAWRTVCRTPRNDPRQESGRYRFERMGSDRLRFVERSEYDWKLKRSRCRAVRTARRTFERVRAGAGGGGGTAGRKGHLAGADGPRRRCVPGEAAALRVVPAEATLQPGARWCPRLLRVDTRGCPLSGRVEGVSWRVEPEGLARLDEEGCIAPLPEAEGRALTVAAREGGQEARAVVRVRAMGLADLIAGGRVESPQRGEPEPPSNEEAKGAAVAEAEAVRASRAGGGLGLWVLALGAMLLGGGAMLGVWLLRRRRRGEAVGRSHGAPGEGSGPRGGEEVVSEERMSPPSSWRSVSAGARVCPACRRSLPADALRCPHDGEPTVAYQDYLARQREAARHRGRVCPRCGTRYGPEERFCGEDGAPLL